jgi:uncharacterized protein YyaL (SSP411 family)
MTKTWTRLGLGIALQLVLLSGCAQPQAKHAQPVGGGHAGAASKSAPDDDARATPDEVDIVKARALGREQLFDWVPWSKQTFARAKRDGRLILVHGAAEWCHWCHVMEETTYRDPRVGAIIRDRFVAIRVDIDARPDIEERYGEWGWPATIVLSPDAEEIGKYRGYVPTKRMLANLTGALEARDTGTSDDGDALLPRQAGAPSEALWWVGANYTLRMDSFYDPREGGWGWRQKAPIADNILFELRRYEHGDKPALKRALMSLRKQAALIDPVWGGIYQYSTGKTWTQPHYEKLMTYQAPNLSAYADAYRLTQDARMLAWARDIERYINSFLSNDAGGFLVTQDADVGAHERQGTFVDGATYYKLGDTERRKLGIPRVDEHVYAEENGLAIAALCTLYEATKDAAVLARAQRAANLLLTQHVDDRGRVLHDANSKRGVYYLADASAFGFALARLAEVTTASEQARYQSAAVRIAEAVVRDLSDEQPTKDATNDATKDRGGAYFAQTADPDASGVFSRRRKPYGANVATARLFAALARLTGDDSYRKRAQHTLAAIAVPQALRERGRMIGSYLLALDEADALRWSP